MIEINLLPEERRKKEPVFSGIDLGSVDLSGLPFIKIAGGAFGVLVAIQCLLFLVGVCGRFYLNGVRSRYERLLPERTVAEKLKSETSEINKKVAAIDDLMVGRFSWARKLSALNESMTPGIWLTELSYDERAAGVAARPSGEKTAGRFLIITGYASGQGEQSTALVGRFIKSLKENPEFYSSFGDIELGAIRRDRIDGQGVMNFRITCLFEEKA
jgi:hypothetical protein